MIRKRLMFLMLLPAIAIAPMTLLIGDASAYEFKVAGNPLYVMGFIQQSVNYSIGCDENNTKEDFNSFLMQGLVEMVYKPLSGKWEFFTSAKLNVDWAYEVFDSDREWQEKGLDESKDRLEILDDFDDVLSECHLTWRPTHELSFRVGKQIIIWGETIGFRLMDQINPLDQRRGLSDVQFENTILPLWMIKANWGRFIDSTVMSEVMVEAFYNPNLKFRGNEGIGPGTDHMGAWAPHVPAGPNMYIGSFIDSGIDEPDDGFSGDADEFGVKISAMIKGALVSVNYFYGRDNDAAWVFSPAPPGISINEWDNSITLHLPRHGYYPRFRFVGASFARDIDVLKASFLGGVAPMVTVEAWYAFDNTFGSNISGTFEQSDEFRWAIAADWKVKINKLNDKAYFFISPTFFSRKIIDSPYDDYYHDAASGTPLEDNNYNGVLFIKTTYLKTKLEPMFIAIKDFTNHSTLCKVQLSYAPDHRWKYALGALFFAGSEPGESFEPFETGKNQVYFTLSYRFQ